MSDKIKREGSFQVRDLRDHGFFTVDNAYLDGKWLRLLKGCPTAVYFALCRHANKEQISFPSIDYLAEETGYKNRHVIDSIKRLEDHHLIKVDRQPMEHNLYALLNRKHWRRAVMTKKEPTVIDKGDPLMKGVDAYFAINVVGERLED